MPVLSLGVTDVAYSDPDAKGAVTTGEVAEFLEQKYHVIETFYELHKQQISDELGSAVAERIESLLQGNPGTSSDLAVDGIDEMFRKYLDAGEWEAVSGQMVMAARTGVSHRKKKKKREGARPAFIDTGLYQASFRSWLHK